MSPGQEIIVIPRAKLQQIIQEHVSAAVQQAVQRQANDLRELKEKLYVFKNVLTHKEVAYDYLNGEVSPETVVRYIKEEGLPATKRGRLWYVEVEKLEQWLRRQDDSE